MSLYICLKSLRRASLIGLVAALFAADFTLVLANEVLSIGSKAPELSIERWISDGKVVSKPKTKFEKDKVYVIDFRAVWCGPCVISLPHLVELQNKYGKKRQIVSFSDKGLDPVNTFLARDFTGKEGDYAAPKTYAEPTSACCITAAPDRSCHTNYMEAAGQNGISFAFVISKDQMIEFIGQPMQMDEPLAKVLDRILDRKAFAQQFEEQNKLNRVVGSVMRLARTSPEDAVEKTNEVIESAKSQDIKLQLTMLQAQILAQSGNGEKAPEAIDNFQGPANVGVNPEPQMMRVQLLNSSGTPEQIAEAANAYYDSADANSQMVNAIAWSIVERTESRQLDDNSLINLSIAAVQTASKKLDGDMKGATLDTLDHLQSLHRDKAAAIKTQEEATAACSNA